MLNKRGQITVFMVLGIILLFSTALIFYIKGKVQVPEEELIPALEEIPDILVPVRQYVEGCAKEVAEQAVKRAMEHGGIINTSEINIKPNQPTESQGIEIIPLSNIVVPYWFYMASENECTGGCSFVQQQPPLCKTGRIGCYSTGENSIEKQIEEYLDNNIKACIMDFRELRIQGYNIEELGNLTTQVNIRQKDMTILIKYPLEVEKAGAKTKVADYYAATRTYLPYMYEIADKVFDTLNCSVEEYTLIFMSYYQGVDPSLLPPNFDTTLDTPKRIVWSKFLVDQKLKQITSGYMNILKVFNSSNALWPNKNRTGEYGTLKQALYEHAFVYALDNYEEIQINFLNTPFWEPYIDIKPSQGGMIRPSSEYDPPDVSFWKDLMKRLNPLEYRYFYSYSYPYLVELRYEDELGEIHLFRFAMEANIKANKCFKPEGEIVKGATGTTSSLLCDRDMWSEINRTIRVKDDYNYTELDDVKVSYYAGETCILGNTDAKGELKTQMPDAYGYFLRFEKDGYMKRVIHQKDISFPLETTLKPIFKLDVELLKIDNNTLKNIRTASTNAEAFEIRKTQSKKAAPEETILIQLERIKDSYQDTDFEKFISYQKGEMQPKELEIVPGKYHVNIQLFLNKNITIPEEHDRICVEGTIGDCKKIPVDEDCSPRGPSEEDFKAGDCYKEGYKCVNVKDAILDGLKGKGSSVSKSQIAACTVGGITAYLACATIVGCVIAYAPTSDCTTRNCIANEPIDYDGQNMTIFPNGGAVLTNKTIPLYIDYSDLEGKNKIQFYMFKQKIPKRQHHLQELNKYEELSKTYRKYIEPNIR